MNDLDQEFSALPEQVKRFLLETVRKDGPNPMGEVLLNNTNIYKLTYSLSEQSKTIWVFTGQKRAIEKEGCKIRVEVTQIMYDWVETQRTKTPVFVVMARRIDGQRAFVYDVISTDKYSIVCHPPEH